MTTSLARHGEGLGTLGLPETKLRELSAEAGFSDVRRVPVEVPLTISTRSHRSLYRGFSAFMCWKARTRKGASHECS